MIHAKKIEGLTASHEMSINPSFEIDPATLVTKERSLARFLSQFSWDGMYDWLQVRLPNNLQNSC